MAELSKDTLAIIERLKTEGAYVRNGSGGGDRNSLKAIKLELRKFEGTFQAMKEAMTGVQALSTEQSEYNRQKAERDVQLADLNEEELAEYKKVNADKIKREQLLEVQALKDKEKASVEKKKENTKIFGKDGLLISGIKKAFNVAVIAAFAALGYSAIAGFLEGYLPEYFGPDGKIGDLPNTVFELYDKMSTYLTNINWEGLAKNLNTLANPEFLSNIGLVAGGAAVAAGASMIPVGEVPGAAGKATSMLVKGGIAATLFGAVNLAWPKVEEYIYKEVRGMSPEKIAELDGKTTGLDAAKMGIQSGMTMAIMFGSKAGIWGAVAGFALGIGMMAIEYMNEKRSQVEKDFLYEYTNNLDLITRAMKNDDMTEEDIEKLVEMHEEGMSVLSRTQNEQTAKLIRANLANINKALMDKLGPERFETVFGNADFTDSTLQEMENVAIQRALDGDGSGLDSLLKLYKAMKPNDTQEEIAEYARGRLAGIGFDNSGRLGDVFNLDGKFGDGVPDVPLAIQKFEKTKFIDMLNASISGMRTGSYGFKDFGKGTLAMLHGEEAVIARNSLEGQILEGLRNGSTVSNMTEQIATAMSSSGTSAPIIVNNVNNSSNPISVQSSTGGARVANTRISGGGGGGGGGSYIDMPGLVT